MADETKDPLREALAKSVKEWRAEAAQADRDASAAHRLGRHREGERYEERDVVLSRCAHTIEAALSAPAPEPQGRYEDGVKAAAEWFRANVGRLDTGGADEAADDMLRALRASVSGASRGSVREPCRDDSPGWFTGRWRDWHRGHGCAKDDGKPRTPEGASEIARGPTPGVSAGGVTPAHDPAYGPCPECKHQIPDPECHCCDQHEVMPTSGVSAGGEGTETP